jgi:hypothetical protein
MHPGALQARGNCDLAAGFDHSRRSAKFLRVEFRIAHALLVALDGVGTLASFLRAGGVAQ